MHHDGRSLTRRLQLRSERRFQPCENQAAAGSTCFDAPPPDVPHLAGVDDIGGLPCERNIVARLVNDLSVQIDRKGELDRHGNAVNECGHSEVHFVHAGVLRADSGVLTRQAQRGIGLKREGSHGRDGRARDGLLRLGRLRL